MAPVGASSSIFRHNKEAVDVETIQSSVALGAIGVYHSDVNCAAQISW